MKNYEEYKYYLKVDHYRNFGKEKSKLSFKLSKSRYKLLFLFRTCQFLKLQNKNVIIRKIYKILENYYYQLKLGIELPLRTKIGKGICLSHPNGIVINSNVVIGDNCTILQQVTIGNNSFKGKYDLAKIGNNVVIGAGAKIIGPVNIEDNVNIGANAVVVKDVSKNSVVGGIPAKVLSKKNLKYIMNILGEKNERNNTSRWEWDQTLSSN